MSSQDIKLGVEVTDKGTTQKVEQRIQDLNDRIAAAATVTKEFRAELKKLNAESNKSAAISGGTAGSRKMADKASSIGTYAAQRGVAEATGAASRDFANQAQGLGGIVRLYATYAANIFALGAAFRSLSDSMDTTNMVKGLDQLGAASGRNLGGLSKRVAELAGGAISLREAMQAVAQTSSGGMTSKNIERLAAVAKSASSALGVSMPDAISRLSRGITKLEPELLDELGIMTRLEPATQAYARQIGKATSQLTDFERRQAFANAVLLEGEMKFGAITEASTNSYDKLLSSLKDVIQIGTTALNKVLTPAAEILASSPNALAAGMVALSAIIIKQALPAVGEFKQGLAEAAETSASIAKQRVDDAASAHAKIISINTAEVNAIEDQYNALADVQINAQKRITDLRGKDLRKSSSAYKLLNADVETVTEAELKRTEVIADRLAKRGLTEEAKGYREIVTAVRAQIKAEDDLVKKELSNQAFKDKIAKAEGTGIAGLTSKLAIEAQNTAIKKSLISNAAYNASLIGMKGAHTILNAEIAKSNLALTATQTIMLRARASIAMYSAVIGTLTSAFMKLTNVLQVIGVVSAVFGILDSMFSKNAKNAEAFQQAFDQVADSVKNVEKTVAHLTKHTLQGTVAGISSSAQALNDLTNSMVKLSDAAKKNKTEMTGVWDILGDAISSAWGGDFASKTAEGLAVGLHEALNLLDNTSLKDEAQATFKKILGINNLNSVNEITKALKNSNISEVIQAMVKLDSVTSNMGARMQALKTATEASTRAHQIFIQTTANTSPLFRLGASLLDIGSEMAKVSAQAQHTSEEFAAVIKHLSEVPDAAVAFDPEFVHQLMDTNDEFKLLNNSISQYKSIIKDLGDKKFQLATVLPKGYDTERDIANLLQVGTKGQIDAIKAIRNLARDKKEIEATIGVLSTQQTEKAKNIFVTGMDRAFIKGATLIERSLGQMMERGAIAIGKASLAGLTGENRARAENSLAMRELEMQLRLIDTNLDLITSQVKLTSAIDKFTTIQNLNAAKQSGKPAAEITLLEIEAEAARVFHDIIQQAGTFDAGTIASKTSNPNVANLVRGRSTGYTQRTAEQHETRTFVRSQMEAQGIAGAIGIRTGALEDLQKQLTLESQITQMENARVIAASALVTISTELNAQQQVEYERGILLNKQLNEQAVINTTISNSIGANEIAKQQGFKSLILERQQQELKVFNLTAEQKIITAKLELLNRIYEVVRATNEMQFMEGQNRYDALTAEYHAYSQLYSIVENYAVSQAYILGNQKVELDYVRAISLASETYYKRVAELEAKRSVLMADPEENASRIREMNDELARQASINKAAIGTARSNLNTQRTILEINKKAGDQQARYNRLLLNSTTIAENLSSAFGDVGGSIGKMIEAFGSLTVNISKNAEALQQLEKERSKFFDEGNLSAVAAKEEEIGLQRTKMQQQEIAGYGKVAGAAKNMFDEKSTGYEILSAIEKAAFILHTAITLKQMAMDAMSVSTSLASNTAKAAGNAVEAQSAGGLAIMKSLASLPPPLNFAAAAVMAGVVAALMASMFGGSSKSVSIPGGVTAEDVQSSQGTGRKFIGGKLQDTNFGALGSSTDKVEDIANSIDLIQKHTGVTSSYGSRTLSTLQAIEENTKSLASALFRTTNIGKLTSGFGTVEKAAAAASTGMLSSFIPKTTKSVEIIDKGIQVIGNFNDILKGTASYLEFETLKSTKVKSGFLGIGGKTKIKISENTKALQQDAQEVIIELFSNLANTAITASKEILGQADTSIQNILDSFVVSFKTSGMGLSGEDFAKAILSESSVVMNEIIATALPALDQFRMIGEGFTTTIVRLATTLDVVNSKMGRLGVDFASKAPKLSDLSETTVASMDSALSTYNTALQKIITNTQSIGTPSQSQLSELRSAEIDLVATRRKVTTEMGGFAYAYIEEVNKAQAAYTKANLAIADNVTSQKEFAAVNKLLSGEIAISSNSIANASNSITDDVIGLYNASKALTGAMNQAISVLGNQTILTLKFYSNLVDKMGGLEAFTEQTDYFFDNFYSGAEQVAKKTEEVNSALLEFVNVGVLTYEQARTLTDGVGNLRIEYRDLIQAQNLTTESGVNATAALMKFAPAIVDISDAIEDAATSVKKSIGEIANDFGVGVDAISGLVNDALLGKLDADTLGEDIANTIKEGFYRAVSESFVTEITNSIVSNLVAPILSGVLNMATVSSAVGMAAINQSVADMVSKTNVLATLLNNDDFKQSLTILSTSISQVVTRINSNAKTLMATFSSLKITDYLTEINDLRAKLGQTDYDPLIEAEQTRLDLLLKQQDALTSAVETFKDFTKSLADFKQSLLTGDLSPLTPIQQYNTIRSELDTLYQTASTSINDEDRIAALQKIQEVSSGFLQASRDVYASGNQYTQDFDYVQGILANLVSDTANKASLDEQQLVALKVQITNSEIALKALQDAKDSLNNIDNSTAGMQARLAELTLLLTTEYAKAGTAVTQAFTTLDTNISGVLTLDELKASGIASDTVLNEVMRTLDTNGDGQITRLESIMGSSSGTFYTLQSITPILHDVNTGIISLSTGLTKIAEINAANVAAGGSAVSGTYSPTTGYGYSGSNVLSVTGQPPIVGGTSGGYISGGSVFGAQGSSISLTDAKAAILGAAESVMRGEISARNAYDTFMQWGASSSLVGQILGVSAQDVLTWFKAQDPSIPAFATGTNYVTSDMQAYIHEGERIMPKADNAELMRVLDHNRNNNDELLVEIRRLNEKVARLEIAIAEGAIINAEATERNTAEISKTVKEATSQQQHIEVVRRIAKG